MTDSIGEGHVVGYRFSVRGDDGQLLAQNEEGELAYYLHGTGTSPAGLEKHMAGRCAGETFSTTLEPEDAFGTRGDDRQIAIPRQQFPEEAQIEPGMHVVADTPEGAVSLWVVQADDQRVVLDLDHPLAGRRLHFEVEIVSVRTATEDEVEHGHPHVGEHAH